MCTVQTVWFRGDFARFRGGFALISHGFAPVSRVISRGFALISRGFADGFAVVSRGFAGFREVSQAFAHVASHCAACGGCGECRWVRRVVGVRRTGHEPDTNRTPPDTPDNRTPPAQICRRTTTRHGPYRMNEAMVHELKTHPSRSLPWCGLGWPSVHRSELVRPIECSELPSCIVFGLCHQLTPTTAQSVCALRPKRCSQEEGEHWSGSTSGNVPLTVPSQMVDALSRIYCMVSTRFQEIGVR